jgi:hypothetical protein
MRLDPNYVLYYINACRITVTGVFPVAVLVLLNYLVYRKLVTRRKGFATIGQ